LCMTNAENLLTRPLALQTLAPMDIILEPQAMLIVVSSPSGGGKSSICQALLQADSNLEYSVSVTSRKPRGGEVHGRDYHFVSEPEFHRLVQEEMFYEWAKVHDNYYGTQRDLIEQKLQRGKDVVLDLDVVGGLNVKKVNDKAVLVFVLPPSFEVLEKRLRGRNTDHDAEIQKRLRNARHEINFAEKYDYVVLNEDLQLTIAAIRRIIDAERHASKHQRMRVVGEDELF
jgi:guanylate kinase